jgi:hypothetical protein
MYSRKHSLCFVFQAGTNGNYYHWDDDTGTLHRIMVEPQTVEECFKGFRRWKLDGPQSELIPRTKAGQERFNNMRREQYEREAEIKQQQIWRFVSYDN